MAVALGALCAWATLPFGGAAAWARASVVLGALLVGWLGWVMVAPAGGAAPAPRPWWRSPWWLATALFAWLAVQLAAMPIGLLAGLQPLARAGYRLLFPGGGFTSLAFNPGTSGQAIVQWAAYGLLLAAAVRGLRGRAARSLVFHLLLGIGATQAVIGILLYRSDWWNAGPFAGFRMAGTFSSGNAFGGLLAITVPLTLGALFGWIAKWLRPVGENRPAPRLLQPHSMARNWPMLALLAALLVQGAALLMSGSRGALVAAGLAGTGLSVFFYARVLRSRAPAIRIGFLLAMTLCLLVASGPGRRMLEQRRAAAAPGFTLARLHAWAAAGRMLVDHPLGVGLGCAAEGLPRYQPAGWGDVRLDLVHNDYLQAACELGVIGAIPLAALLVWALRRGRAVLALPKGGRDAWLAVGGLAGVAAALAHALVDFNLSTRPGVTVPFLVALGAVLAAAGEAGSPAPAAAAGPEPQPASPLRRALALAGLTLCVAWLGHATYAAAHAAWLQEAGKRAMGFAPDIYFWLPGPDPAGAEAGALLDRACQAAPRQAVGWYLRGMERLATFKERRNRLVNENLDASRQGAGRALSPAERQRIKDLVQAGLKEEELAMYPAAIQDLAAAVQRAPWNADYRSLLAVTLLEQYRAATELHPEALAAGLRQMADAVWLAPHDVIVLTVACQNLAPVLPLIEPAAARRRARSQTIKWGLRALAAAPDRGQAVFEAWRAAGLTGPQILRLPLAAPALRQLYKIFEREADGSNALACLETLLAAPVPSDPRAQRDAFDYAGLVRQQRCRWLFRLGRWADYRALAHAVQPQAYRDLIAAQLAAGLPDAGSSRVQADALRRVRARFGLDPDHSLALWNLENTQGNYQEADRLLCDVYMAALDPDAIIRAVPPDELPAHLRYDRALWHLRATYNAVERGDPDAATAALVQALRLDVPYAYRPRLQCLLATQQLTSGRKREALATLMDALRSAPTCRPALEWLCQNGAAAMPMPGASAPAQRVVDALGAITPPQGLHAAMLGGRVVLRGFDLVADAATDRLRARTYWEFRGPVPADLAAVVAIHATDYQPVLGHTVEFAKSQSVLFSAGEPLVDSVVVLESVFPAPKTAGPKLIMGLQSQGVWLPTMENLAYIEVNEWERFVRRTLPDHGPAGQPALAVTAADPAASATLAASWAALTETSSTTATGDSINVRFALMPVDPDSGLDLSVLGPGGYVLRSRGGDPMVCAASAAGLMAGAGALARLAFDRTMYLPDPAFARPPASGMARQDLWVLDSPAFALRELGQGFRATNQWATAWRLANRVSEPALTARAPFEHHVDRLWAAAMTPDIFPEIAGQRPVPEPGNWQPCLSVSGLALRAAATITKAWQAPGAPRTYSLTINDSTNWCECAGCQALAPPDQRSVPAANRWWSQPYWGWVNAVAGHLAPLFPTAQIGAAAYINVQEAPPFPVASNVVVYLCQDAAGYFDARERDANLELLTNWVACAPHVTRYAYAGLGSWVFPRYCPREMAIDIRSAYEAGIRDFYTETCWPQWQDAPLPWMTAQWLWNPWLDAAALQTQFCGAVFGSAADVMDRYFTRLQAAWQSASEGFWFDGLGNLEQQARRYPAPVRRELGGLLDQAQMRLAGDPTALARLDRVRIPWALADLLAQEIELCAEIKARPDEAPRLLGQLEQAIGKRRNLISSLPAAPWAQSLRDALAWGGTLARWEQRETETMDQARKVTIP